MTKKQTGYFFILTMIYSLLVHVSGGTLSFLLSLVPFVFAIVVVLYVEKNGYAK